MGRVERSWLWAKRNPTLVVAGGLGAVVLAALTGAPVAATLAAVAAAALLFALHKAKTAVELTETVEDLKRHQKKTAAAMQFAFRNVALAREERARAVAAEARAGRRLARARELAHAVLFDLPDKIGEPAGPGPAHAFLVRTARAYLDGLAREAGDDAALLRELAVAYARLGDLQGGRMHETGGDAAEALATHRKSLEIFAAVARALPDNAQAQRDLAVCRMKVADLEQAAGAAPKRR